MKVFISMFLLTISMSAFAYFPTVKGYTEARLIASSKDGIAELSKDNWTIEGNLTGTHSVSEQLSLSGVFQLSTSKKNRSELGALASYHLNKFVTLSVVGNVNDEKDFGAIFKIHANLSVGKMTFLPFIKVDHKAVAEVGLAQTFKVDGVIFSVGLSYVPPINGENHNHNVRLMIGTGLSKKI